jgi:hypothetical protein
LPGIAGSLVWHLSWGIISKTVIDLLHFIVYMNDKIRLNPYQIYEINVATEEIKF